MPFILLLTGFVMAESVSPLGLVLVESDLHAYEDHRGKARPASCMLIADLENHGKEPLRFTAKPLVVRDAKGKTIGSCNYERALVWEDTKGRSRFTTYEPPLAPGEKVKLKLIYNFVDGNKKAVKQGASYSYRASFDICGKELVVEGAPFKPEVFPRDGGI